MQPQSRSSSSVCLAGQLCPALPAGLCSFRGEQPGFLGCPICFLRGRGMACSGKQLGGSGFALLFAGLGILCGLSCCLVLPMPLSCGVGCGQSSLCVWGSEQQPEPVGFRGSGMRMKLQGRGCGRGRGGKEKPPVLVLACLLSPSQGE